MKLFDKFKGLFIETNDDDDLDTPIEPEEQAKTSSGAAAMTTSEINSHEANVSSVRIKIGQRARGRNNLFLPPPMRRPCPAAGTIATTFTL